MADPSERFVLRPDPPHGRREPERARDSLRALMTFIKNEPDSGFDWWPVFIRVLADVFHASASVIWHEFGTTQQGELLLPAYSNPEYIAKYKSYSHFNPWLPFLFGRNAGFFIEGEKANPLTRTDSTAEDKQNFKLFFEEWMLPQNLIRGLGAVLLKDKPIVPDWVVGVGIMRPDGEPGIGLYTPEEKQEFDALISFMRDHIERCPTVIEHISQYKRRKAQYNHAATARGTVPPPEYTADELIDMLLAVKRSCRTRSPGFSGPPSPGSSRLPRSNPTAFEATLAALDEVTANTDTPSSWRATVLQTRGMKAPSPPEERLLNSTPDRPKTQASNGPKSMHSSRGSTRRGS